MAIHNDVLRNLSCDSLTRQGESQTLGVAVVESDVFQMNGDFGLLVFDVPLQGRNEIDTATNSTCSIISMKTCYNQSKKRRTYLMSAMIGETV